MWRKRTRICGMQLQSQLEELSFPDDPGSKKTSVPPRITHLTSTLWGFYMPRLLMRQSGSSDHGHGAAELCFLFMDLEILAANLWSRQRPSCRTLWYAFQLLSVSNSASKFMLFCFVSLSSSVFSGIRHKHVGHMYLDSFLFWLLQVYFSPKVLTLPSTIC